MPARHATSQEVECFPTQKWIRVYVNGQAIADSRRCLLVRSAGRPAEYYFPKQDVETQYLTAAKPITAAEKGKHQQYWDVRVGDQQVPRAASEFPPSLAPTSGMNDSARHRAARYTQSACC